MNVNKLTAGGTAQPSNSVQGGVPRRFNHNAQSQLQVQEKKKISEFMDITETEFLDLVSERDILAAEIIFTRTGQQYTSQCYELLQQYEKTAAQFERTLANQSASSHHVNETIQASIFAEMEVILVDQRKDEQRKAVDSRLTEIEKNVVIIQQQTTEILKKIEGNDLDSFDRNLHKAVSSIQEKIQEIEEISKNMQRSYIQRLTKILDTRKQAETNFLEERKKLTSMIKDLEILYQRRNETFQSRLKKELSLMKSAYDKLKDENGKMK